MLDVRDNFIRLAEAKGFLTTDQIRQCMAYWDSLPEEGREPPWDCALQMGFLSPKYHKRIAGHMDFIGKREEDKGLGAAAVGEGIIQPADLEVGLMIQRKAHREKGEVRRLEAILLEMGVLLAEDVPRFRGEDPQEPLEELTPEDELETFLGTAPPPSPEVPREPEA